MPGIFGFSKLINDDQAFVLLKGMASALAPEERFTKEFFAHAGLGIGRASLGILNPAKQPLWDQSQQVGIVFEGEIFEPLPQATQLATQSDNQKNAESLFLHLYLAEGVTFASRINGAFCAAILDLRDQKIVVINDRLGLYPIYYYHRGGEFAFASGVRALLVDPSLPRNIDRIAIQEFLTFDHVLGQRTLLEDVQLMPQASVAAFQHGQFNIAPYYHFKYTDVYPFREPESYREQFIFEMKRAAQRQSTGNQPKGVMLSGGLDSRFLVASLAEQIKPDSLHTFTWSIPKSDDARYAREVASVLNTRHHFFELRPDWLMTHGEKAVRLTDGMGNLVNLHAMANIEEEAKISRLIYKGFMGDAMFGFGLRPRFWADYDRETEIQEHLQAYRDYRVLTFDLPEHSAIFTDSFLNHTQDGLLQDFSKGMRAAAVRQMATQRLYFDLTQRVPRMTINGVLVARDQAAIRLPFTDNDLVEFSMTIPPYLAFERRLMMDAFIHAYPKLARIPTPRDHLPMVSCAREMLMRNAQFIKWHLRRMGLNWIAGPESRPYKDYHTWFRTGLRHWVEETLLSQQSLERGYFQPERVRQLVNEHMNGRNHSVRLGAMMAIELWHRMYID